VLINDSSEDWFVRPENDDPSLRRRMAGVNGLPGLSCHPEQSEGSSDEQEAARFFAPLRMT